MPLDTFGALWDQIHAELWLRSHSFRSKLSTQSVKSKQQGSFIPKGFCWKFHMGIACPGCSYKHQCFRFGNSHPNSKCKQASKQPAVNTGPKTSFTVQSTPNRIPLPSETLLSPVKARILAAHLSGYPEKFFIIY